jgi:hypothetical protein
MWEIVIKFLEMEVELLSGGGVRLDGGVLLDEGHVAHGGDHNLRKNNFVTSFQILKVDLPFEQESLKLQWRWAWDFLLVVDMEP